jgi:hypothetical protein
VSPRYQLGNACFRLAGFVVARDRIVTSCPAALDDLLFPWVCSGGSRGPKCNSPAAPDKSGICRSPTR